MTTMLEKAAMAAAGVGNGSISPEEYWERYTSPAGKERDIERIRAALQAIREPSNEMLAPACKTHKPGKPMSEARPEECPSITRRRSRFTAMIDAILEGKA